MNHSCIFQAQQLKKKSSIHQRSFSSPNKNLIKEAIKICSKKKINIKNYCPKRLDFSEKSTKISPKDVLLDKIRRRGTFVLGLI